MNLYDALGVAKDATSEAIKKAYRKLAQKHHPDREGGDPEKFHQVALAYEVLSDPESRARYDETGETEQVKSALSEAEDFLMTIFAQEISKDEPGDLIERIKDKLQRGINSGISDAEETQKEVDELKMHEGRIESAHEYNLFAMVLEQKIRHLQQSVEQAMAHVKTMETARDILDSYRDTKPKPRPESTYKRPLFDFDVLRSEMDGMRGSAFGYKGP